MHEVGDVGSTATPQLVLDVLHRVSKRCQIRLPQVTPEIEALAHCLDEDVIAGLLEQLALSLKAFQGLKQFTEAVATYREMRAEEIGKLPLVLGPSQAKLLDDDHTLHLAFPFWEKMMTTDFIQRAQLMTNDPFVLKQRKDLAVVQTTVFTMVQRVLEQAGIHNRGSAPTIALPAGRLPN